MKYRTIVADPPWHYEGFVPSVSAGRIGSASPMPYPSMEIEEIAGLPVPHLAEYDSWLFLWTTGRYLRDAFAVVEAWGFSYRQMVTWAKRGAPPFGGTFTHNAAEYLIAGARGHPPVKGRWPGGNVITTNRQGAGGHSRKPEVFLDFVETVAPGPYLELFARRNRLGWDTWGNEALNHVELLPEGR